MRAISTLSLLRGSFVDRKSCRLETPALVLLLGVWIAYDLAVFGEQLFVSFAGTLAPGNHKMCASCGLEPPQSDFYNERVICKTCSALKVESYRKAEGGSTKVFIANARKLAKRHGCRCTLTSKDILDMLESQAGRCYFSNVSLNLSLSSCWQMSIKRLDIGRGYEKRNCVLIAAEFNAVAGLSSPEANCEQWTRSKVREVFSLRRQEVDMDSLRRKIQEARSQPPQKHRVTGREPNEVGEWPCSMCFQYKDLDEFGKSYTSSLLGSSSICKACVSAKIRQPTTLRGYLQTTVLRKTGLVLDNVLEMLDRQGGRCYYSGVPLRWRQNGNFAWSMRLERLDRSQGYSRENCVLVAWEFRSASRRGQSKFPAHGPTQWSQDKVEQIWGVL